MKSKFPFAFFSNNQRWFNDSRALHIARWKSFSSATSPRNDEKKYSSKCAECERIWFFLCVHSTAVGCVRLGGGRARDAIFIFVGPPARVFVLSFSSLSSLRRKIIVTKSLKLCTHQIPSWQWKFLCFKARRKCQWPRDVSRTIF